jgi:hypothetical protein
MLNQQVLKTGAAVFNIRVMNCENGMRKQITDRQAPCQVLVQILKSLSDTVYVRILKLQ